MDCIVAKCSFEWCHPTPGTTDTPTSGTELLHGPFSSVVVVTAACHVRPVTVPLQVHSTEQFVYVEKVLSR